MKTIKQGYIVEITTAENDADYINTTTFDGLDKSQVEFLRRVCDKFKSAPCTEDPSKFGNTERPDWKDGYDIEYDKVIKWFNDTFGEFEISNYDWLVKYYCNEGWYEVIESIIGISEYGERFRYCSDYKLYYNTIEINLVEITELE